MAVPGKEVKEEEEEDIEIKTKYIKYHMLLRFNLCRVYAKCC